MEFGSTQTLNAKIKFSYLGICEDGSLCFRLGFDTQGGVTFQTNMINVSTQKITDILNTLEVRSWEELPRKFSRIKVENKTIKSVGNLIENKWVEL